MQPHSKIVKPTEFIVIVNGPEAIDMAKKAAESYHVFADGFPLMRSRFLREKAIELALERFEGDRATLLGNLRVENPTKSDHMIVQRADEMIAEALHGIDPKMGYSVPSAKPVSPSR